MAFLVFIVGALRAPAPVDDVIESPLFEEPLSVVARPDHPLFQRARVTRKDLAQAEWVVPRYGTPTRALFEKTFRDAGLAIPRNTIEASSLVAVRALLSESDRLTIISLSQIDFERRAGLLRALSIALPATTRPIGTTVRSNTSSSPALAACLEEIGAVSSQMSEENPGVRKLRHSTIGRA